MKNIHVKAILMAFVVLMPLALSTIHVLIDDTSVYECCKNLSNEEQNEERETEEDTEPLEGFIHESQLCLITRCIVETNHTINNAEINGCYTDILTPPPKFS